MFSKISTWLVAASLVIGSAAIASAHDERGGKSGQMGKAHEMKRQAGPMKVIRGRVVATKSVQLRGTNERHLVALIRTEDGVRRVVDLGPRNQARDLELAEGDSLDVRGRVANVEGRQIFIAKQARSGDRRLNIDRSQQHKHFDAEMRRAHGKEKDAKRSPDRG